ncbi:MAG TPA: glycoside hydrolase family 125 protein [Candidatus Rubrimentiphilum sp.]|nr:glycoside hydrolase family 125 protein [Candidatus Rubrimentiphilum sp.]
MPQEVGVIAWTAHVRRIAAALTVVLAFSGTPARAQSLVLPLTGHRASTIEPASLFHTLFTDFFSERDGTTYVQTGDIPAMWLRDSSAQSIPYVRFAPGYPILAVRLLGVIERDARNVGVDPYANAFTANYRIWERKWEADSLAWPVLLAWVVRQQTGTRALFTPAFHHALRASVDTWRCEQLHATCSRYHTELQTEPYNPQTGMIWTAYRPSDDPVRYHFNIPQEAIAAIALRVIAKLAVEGYGDRNLANEANAMSAQVEDGIELYGRAWRPELGGWVYAYETDGNGAQLFADDANIPNLTAMPYIGWSSSSDPVYLNTRSFALSTRNPWYFKGLYASGLGSEHTPPGYVWPLGIIARALTATSSQEIAASVTTLAETDSKDGLIHESFYGNGYWVFTRAEFGWANAVYAELLFRTLAGFSAPPLTSTGTPVISFEELSGTPAIVSEPIERLYNTTLIYAALNRLLAEADGRTVVPGAPAMVMTRSGGSAPHTASKRARSRPR